MNPITQNNPPTFWNYVSKQIDPLTGKYVFELIFTDKPGYLHFRALWKEAYREATEKARECRRVKRLYREAGGFRNELAQAGLYPNSPCPVSDDLPQIAEIYCATPPDREKRLRREMCEIRVMSKSKAAQLCNQAKHRLEPKPDVTS